MQAIKFTRALEEISRQLKAQELIEFLRPYMRPEGANAPVTPQDRARFTTLLFDSRSGFTELSRNQETKSLLDAFQLVEVYDSGRLSDLIALLVGVPATHNVIANLETYKIFLRLFEPLSSIVNFATVAAKFLVADKVHPPTEGDEVLELLILDYDGTGVLTERVQQSLTSLIELHTHLSRILGITDGGLKIAYTDSGSDIAIGVVAAAALITALRHLFIEYWERVKFRQFSESDRGMQSLEKALTINQKLREQVDAKALTESANKFPRTGRYPGILFSKEFSFCYFALLAFWALNFAQYSLLAFEILALPAADMVRLRLTPLVLTSFELTGAGCEPFSARIAP